ncbi:MAG: HAMP domain-containing histidine kinase [Myxococcaceae bacterium]|nr:HAMP domain-containing histidine kinase [Myxococcaceae bacterium]
MQRGRQMAAARYTPRFLQQLVDRLFMRAFAVSGAYGAMVVATEWGHRFGSAFFVYVIWVTACLVLGRIVAPIQNRFIPHAVFVGINFGVVLGFGLVTGWSVPALMAVPVTIATFDIFGNGDTRPYILTMLVAYAAAMALGGVDWRASAVVLAIGFAIHWLFEGRGDYLRATLAALEESKASLEDAMKAQLQAEAELRQAHKLESVGRLAAGIAHEINTPVQFVSDNLSFITKSTTDLSTLVQLLKSRVTSTDEVEKAIIDADLEFVLENLPMALESSRDGLQRIGAIVRSMREFAHPELRELGPVDLVRGIQNTLTIAKSEWKLVADLETDLAPLPKLLAHGGELNQVVLNIVVNAAQAIRDRVGKTGKRGRITVRTRADREGVTVSIADTGGGIPAAIRDRIFEPFFTTKDVGQGTGQGLAIARSVVSKHGGTLTFDSRPGEGTTFFIRLPVPAEALT